uniref:Uncharacterized protein n=1 Tax=Fervidicoccus fontis TaxID=683846 RepID=A0A7C1E9G4_9CREN
MFVKVLGAKGDIAMRRQPRMSMSTADNLAIAKPLKGTLALQGGEKVCKKMLSNSSTRSR